jgi:hypothetical protein
MTQDEIIEMARFAGIRIDNFGFQGGYIEEFEAFAKLVAAKAFQNGYEKGVAGFNEAVSLEREVCAKVCEKYAAANTFWTKAAVKDCAAAIRARGEA